MTDPDFASLYIAIGRKMDAAIEEHQQEVHRLKCRIELLEERQLSWLRSFGSDSQEGSRSPRASTIEPAEK